MWKVAVVLSAGTAILAGWSGARSEVPNAHDFSEYLIRLACQGRRAFAVTKPGSFVIVHLAAYSSVAQSRSRRWGFRRCGKYEGMLAYTGAIFRTSFFL